MTSYLDPWTIITLTQIHKGCQDREWQYFYKGLESHLNWAMEWLQIGKYILIDSMWHLKSTDYLRAVLKYTLYVKHAFVFVVHLVLHVQRRESHLKLAAQFEKQQVVHPTNRL